MKEPKSTDTFEFYNANPKNKKTEDCVFRALSVALEQTWEDTLMEMAKLSCKTGYAITGKNLINKYLESKGWKKNKQPRKSDGRCYTGKEFVKTFKGMCIANIGSSHIVCIRDGKVIDIWDSTDCCIGNYWTKE